MLSNFSSRNLSLIEIKKASKEEAKVIIDLAGGTGDVSNSLASHFKNSQIFL